MSGSGEPTGSLNELMDLVRNDLCHRCGTCVGICPLGVLGESSENFPLVKNGNLCSDCGKCVKVCPGASFDAPACAQKLWGEAWNADSEVGHVRQGFLGYSGRREIRAAGASGGVVTSLLLALLDGGEIDAAVVVAQDPELAWQSRVQIARSREEIVAAASSRYSIAPTGAALAEILSQPGRYAFVGLPCQIHGFRNAARLSADLRARVVLTIGLFCHSAVDYEAFRLLWACAGVPGGTVAGFSFRVGKPAGYPLLRMRDGTVRPLLFPQATNYRPDVTEMMNVLYRLYSQPRCLTCYDATAEFADVAVGDPWGIRAPNGVDYGHGYSCVFARTERGQELLSCAEKRGFVNLTHLSEVDWRGANRSMRHAKRRRAFRLIRRLRKKNRRVPDYGFEIPPQSLSQRLLADLDLMQHSFSLHGAGRRVLARILFSRAGYPLFWLNHQRRRVFSTLRDLRFAHGAQNEATNR